MKNANEKALTLLKSALEAGDTFNAASSKTGQITVELLKFAQECETIQEFLDACKAAEKWEKSAEGQKYKGQYAHLSGDKLPRCWRQTKSDIKQAWELGLDPKDYTKPNDYKKAKIAAKAKAEGKADAPKPITVQGVKIGAEYVSEVMKVIRAIENVSEHGTDDQKAKAFAMLKGAVSEFEKGVKGLKIKAKKQATKGTAPKVRKGKAAKTQAEALANMAPATPAS